MGKRSDFIRRPQDAYMTTDKRAVEALLPHLNGAKTFAEPCAGECHLVKALVDKTGMRCVYVGDIAWPGGIDALTVDLSFAAVIISNTPWTREILHPMISRFCSQKPTWLLFDSDWAYTVQAYPYLTMCTDIVPTPRLKWLADSKWTAKDNTSWYRFDAHHAGPTVFHGRMQ
jgi:hypothetical protein